MDDEEELDFFSLNRDTNLRAEYLKSHPEERALLQELIKQLDPPPNKLGYIKGRR